MVFRDKEVAHPQLRDRYEIGRERRQKQLRPLGTRQGSRREFRCGMMRARSKT